MKNNSIMIIFLATLLACPAAALAAEPPLKVLVSILPQKYFVDRLAGDRAEVTVLVRPGVDPHSYEPSPKVMREAAEARIYVMSGLNLEKAWSGRIRALNPGLALVEPRLPAEEPGESGQELHGHDAHAWLSPSLARAGLPDICAALIKARPEDAALFKANLKKLDAEIAGMDTDIRKIFAGIPAEKRDFITFHPAWGLFAKDYGLREISIETEGKEPGPQTLAKLVSFAQKEGIKILFVEPQFPKNAATAIAGSVGARLETVDPLAYDWSANLLRCARLFAESFTNRR